LTIEVRLLMQVA